MFEQLRTILTASTSNTECCPIHRQKRMHVVDGQLICWICEADKQTATLTKHMNIEHAEHITKKRYNILREASILQDKTLIGATFQTYTQNIMPHTEEWHNKQEAMKAVHAYRHDDEPFNTWFTGDTGVGKSHLAMAMLEALNETDNQQRSCLFVDIDEALRRVRTAYRNEQSRFTESYIIDLMSDVDFLVMDDIGAETGNVHTDKTASDFVNRVLRAVLNARQHKSTIFTTNLTRAQLEHVYDKKLVSRAMRNVFLIKFEQATDKRIRRKRL